MKSRLYTINSGDVGYYPNSMVPFCIPEQNTYNLHVHLYIIQMWIIDTVYTYL